MKASIQEIIADSIAFAEERLIDGELISDLLAEYLTVAAYLVTLCDDPLAAYQKAGHTLDMAVDSFVAMNIEGLSDGKKAKGNRRRSSES